MEDNAVGEGVVRVTPPPNNSTSTRPTQTIFTMFPSLNDPELTRHVLVELGQAQQNEESLNAILKRLQKRVTEEETLLVETQEYLERHAIDLDNDGVDDAIDDGDDDDLNELAANVHNLEQQLADVEVKLKELNDLDSDEFSRVEDKIILVVNAESCSIRQDEEVFEKLHVQRREFEKRLDLLTRTDALNESFFIWHEGAFGTINGLRLGCLPNEPVEWNEINAAFGFAALLLESLASQVGFEFFVWKVSPRGSLSLMVNVQNPSQTLNLYCNSAWFSLWKTSFNAGISAFAECVDELGEFARAEDQSVLLPYRVDRSMIDGLSLHYSNSIEWTKAMKFLLTNIKWLAIWVVRRQHTSLASVNPPKG